MPAQLIIKTIIQAYEKIIPKAIPVICDRMKQTKNESTNI